MTIVIRNTTSPVLCEKYKRRLTTRLKHRGYNKHILKRIWKKKHAHRTTMLLPKKWKSIKERPTSLCIQFTQSTPSIQDILSNRWNIMHNDFRLMTLFPNPPSPVLLVDQKLSPYCLNNAVNITFLHLTLT